MGLDWVSIHAPVKGATVGDKLNMDITSVSIHAPVKGATGAAVWAAIIKCFNPRAREGRDV